MRNFLREEITLELPRYITEKLRKVGELIGLEMEDMIDALVDEYLEEYYEDEIHEANKMRDALDYYEMERERMAESKRENEEFLQELRQERRIEK